jgi:hypothetical protein
MEKVMNKIVFVWFVLMCSTVGTICLIPSKLIACEGRGTYSVSNGKLHLPFIDIVTANGVENVIEAKLQKISVLDTELLFEITTFKTAFPQVDVKPCHATYQYDGQVRIPFVDIPEQNLTVSATLKKVPSTRKGLFSDTTDVQPSNCSPSASELCEFSSSRYVLFLEKNSFAPEEARYAQEIKQTFNLTADEMARLQNNGFVVTDRLAFEDFSNAYAYIYWKDLPVVITTDSILQANHKTYNDLLMRLEAKMLAPQLAFFLTKVRQQVRIDAGANTNPELASLYTDVDSYLSVPLALFASKVKIADVPPKAMDYVELVQQSSGIASVTLFGGERKVDFSLFKPRGHYTKHKRLERYFRAMNWLAHIDFRLVEYDLNGEPRLNVNHITAAVLLHQAIKSANQRTTWQKFDHLINTFVGESDNMTLPDLDRFLADAGIETAKNVLHLEKVTPLLTLLTSGDYGQQQITGQLLKVAPSNQELQARPISFMMLGQRFVIDSYIMSQLVFDQLLVNAQKVPRPLPSPLDVMYVLGNDHAKTHLQAELTQYGYQKNLDSLRTLVEGYNATFWTSNTYNRWLNGLRALNVNTTHSAYPQAMQTSAWADKMLHTQLASWTQLRHDNILHVKQSFTGGVACEYPAGYVEPYPAFYAAVRDYARAGYEALTSLDLTTDIKAEQVLLQLENDDFRITSINRLFPDDVSTLRDKVLAYFEHLEYVTTMLQTIAEKELRLEPFSQKEEAFIKDTAVLQKKDLNICGVPPLKTWNGWYPKLFPWEDESPVLIADIHTNPNIEEPPLAPPSVLHVATGSVVAMVLIVDTDEGPTMYVGPSFSYYEVIEKGEAGTPPNRLTDQDWEVQLRNNPSPTPPDWTTSFRLLAPQPSNYLSVPTQSSFRRRYSR